jgi:hypothetical protein
MHLVANHVIDFDDDFQARRGFLPSSQVGAGARAVILRHCLSTAGRVQAGHPLTTFVGTKNCMSVQFR